MSFWRQGDDHAEHQRQIAQDRRGAGHAPALGLTRPARHERHEVRLRRRALWRLHRALRWDSQAGLRDAGRRRRRPCHHHHRGHRQNASRQEGSAGLARSGGRAVRLLPVGPDHVRRCVAGEDTGADRHRYRPGNVGEHLPLRHLPAYPRGDQARRANAVHCEEGRLTMDRVSRRKLLTVGAATGGGFLLGWHVDPRPRVLAAAAKGTQAAFAPNAFIRIGADGRITLIMSQVEMGQGTYTSMPMLLAEELEVGLDQVRLEHAPPDEKMYGLPGWGLQFTGASTSVRLLYEPLRRAGATARNMLVAAAAQAWNVDAASCRALRGVVTHTPTGRKLAYGALADRAAKLPVPTKV